MLQQKFIKNNIPEINICYKKYSWQYIFVTKNIPEINNCYKKYSWQYIFVKIKIHFFNKTIICCRMFTSLLTLSSAQDSRWRYDVQRGRSILPTIPLSLPQQQFLFIFLHNVLDPSLSTAFSRCLKDSQTFVSFRCSIVPVIFCLISLFCIIY